MQLIAGHSEWRYQVLIFLLLLLGKLCWGLKMQWVPPSLSVNAGKDAKIECKFDSDSHYGHRIVWLQIQQQENVTRRINITDSEAFKNGRVKNHKSETLLIESTQKNDSALYLCKVSSGKETKESCGTFLRVKEPAPAFILLKIGECTKNRVITAEGILLFLCAVIPGTFLLYKKRWENLKILSLKEAEGENLYEGLNLEDCSMYEDISRGLQATYEDVGTLRATDFQLEKP